MSEIFGNGIMGGGGLTNSKLALANAQAADVRSGKKFYAGDKQIKTGTLADVTQATPAITVDAAGKITASATQAAGVVAAGTKSATKQLPVQAAKTVIPSASAQTAVGEGVFTTGIVTVAAVYAVIRVTYPANSTLVVKGTSSGKQFAKDTNTTSSAKAYIFLAPIGDTSYTLTATNTAGKTVSKQVYVAKDQVQSVTLMFETILWEAGSDQNTSLTGGFAANDTNYVKIGDSTVTITGERTYFGSGSNEWSYSGNFYTKKKVTKGEFKYFCANITTNTGTNADNKAWLYAADQQDFTESNTIAKLEIPVTTGATGIFKMPLTGVTSAVLGIRVYGYNDLQTIVTDKIWLE